MSRFHKGSNGSVSHRALRLVSAGRRRASEAWRGLLGDIRGNVAITFGIMAIPVFGMAGAALDYTTMARARMMIQNGMDAGVLAAARQMGLPGSTQDDAVKIGENIILANLPNGLAEYGFTVSFEASPSSPITAYASGFAGLHTTLLHVIGFPYFYMNFQARAAMIVDPTEVVLAIDRSHVSTSWNTPIATGTTNLVAGVFQNDPNGVNVRMGLVPYAGAVNVGDIPGIDYNAIGTYHGENFEDIKITDIRCNVQYAPALPVHANNARREPPTRLLLSPNGQAAASPGLGIRVISGIDAFFSLIGPSSAHAAWPYGPAPDYNTPPSCNLVTPSIVNHFDLLQNMDVPWGGCVEARPLPHAISDTPPDSFNRNTVFVPYFWPDELDPPSSTIVLNDFTITDIPDWVGLSAIGGPGAREQQAWLWKYLTPPTKLYDDGFTRRSPNTGCPDPVIPLQSNSALIINAVENLRSAYQSGSITLEGLAWSWRVLSPTPPFTEGQVLSNVPNLRKVVVLLTAGPTAIVEGNELNRTGYQAWGFGSRGRLADPPGTEMGAPAMAAQLDGLLPQLCDNIKNDGIVIYAIVLGGPLENLTPYSQCATSPAHAFHASDTALLPEIMEQIGKQLNSQIARVQLIQ